MMEIIRIKSKGLLDLIKNYEESVTVELGQSNLNRKDTLIDVLKADKKVGNLFLRNEEGIFILSYKGYHPIKDLENVKLIISYFYKKI
ncbi:hypothetical protein HY498_03495 [Candidatus Woesearchaeota archaeon]|nr:hypothetical protein [Candidatus Woesearchaeota archaeon]